MEDKPHYCKVKKGCTAFCHISWCPEDKKYKEYIEKYNKASWWRKIFMWYRYY